MPVTEIPKEIQACDACGHVPNEGKRYAWLSGCPDTHDVRTWFDVSYLSQGIVHVWDDGSYSALRYDEWTLRFLVSTPEGMLLEWLDACHAGRTHRRQRVIGEMVQFDDLIMVQQADESTGIITVTPTLPLIEVMA